MSDAPTTVPGEVDVLVLGYGGAGASAAMTAHDSGATTLLVEAGRQAGGNTRASGGSLRPVQDPQGALQYLEHLAQGETPSRMLEAFLAETPRTLRWLESLGAELVPLDGRAISSYPRITDVTYSGVPGADAMAGRLRVASPRGELGGEALWNVLEAGVAARGIPVLLGARARTAVRRTDGSFRVVVQTGADEREVVARALVLALGGFGHAADLVEDFVGHPLVAFGPPQNRGDGLLMAQALGADLWHTPAVAATLGYVLDGVDGPVRHQSPAAGFVYVDSSGERFVDETGTDFHALPMAFLKADARTGRYLRMPSYFVFDERTRAAGPIANGGLTWADIDWSEDNAREVEAGLIATSTTIAGLAETLGLDAATLERTIGRYNEGCARRDGDALGRQDLEPVAEPPFYAVPVTPVLVNTQGGPRRDEHGRVLGPDGTVIPGLYAAGELGSMWGQMYPGAGNLTEALVSGRAAGRHAAGEMRS